MTAQTTQTLRTRMLRAIVAMTVVIPTLLAMAPEAEAQATVNLRVSFEGPAAIVVGTEAIIQAKFVATYSSGRHTLSLIVPTDLNVVESEGRCESFDGNAAVVYPGRTSFDYITTSRECTVTIKVRPPHCGRFVLGTEFREVSNGVQRAPLTSTHTVYVRRPVYTSAITFPSRPGATTIAPSPISLIC